MYEQAFAALLYLSCEGECLEEGPGVYGDIEKRETQELIGFVNMAMDELRRRRVLAMPGTKVRITGTYRIYLGARELKLRPMPKSVLLLFLRHPEGIVLKNIYDYRAELALYYRKVSKCSDPVKIEESIARILDLCSNQLNVNISRANHAMAELLDRTQEPLYTINGPAGKAKAIGLSREYVQWEC